MIILNKKNRTTTSIKFGNGIPYISFNALEQTGMVVNAFSKTGWWCKCRLP